MCNFKYLGSALALVLSISAQLAFAQGNLIVERVGDTLLVIGDNEDNSVLVSEFFGEIMIAGHGVNFPMPWMPLFSFGNGTSVNGNKFYEFFDASQVAAVVVITGGGQDSVLLRGDISAEVSVDTGAECDYVQTDPSAFQISAQSIYINSGLGQDSVLLDRITVQEDTNVSSGNKEDLIRLNNANFGGNVVINSGGQDDLIVVKNVIVSGDVHVELGQGNDAVSNFRDPLVGNGPEIIILGAAQFVGGQGSDLLDPSNLVVDPFRLEITGFEAP